MVRGLGIAAVLVLAQSAIAVARSSPAPFPGELLAGYAPLLEREEMAVIESDARGRARQVTLLAWVPAPPSLVHDVVLHAEEYARFIHNVSRSTVERRPEGLVNAWRVELPIGHFDGLDAIRPQPGPAAPIDVVALGPGKQGAIRWEFLPVAGGGTVIVHEAIHDALVDNFLLRRMLERNPTYEQAMALAASLVLVKGVEGEARRQAQAKGLDVGPPPRSARTPGFAPLLGRGTVAVIRSDSSGGLVDVSVVEKVPVPPDVLLAILRAPDAWPGFLASVTHCVVRERDGAGITYRLGVDGILLEVDTTYRMTFVEHGADALGIEGDLKGGRWRFDLTAAGDGTTVAVYRGNARLAGASRILRMMFEHEPSFEHAANVGVGLIALRAMSRRAIDVYRQSRVH